MKIKDLIEKLESLPDDTEIFINYLNAGNEYQGITKNIKFVKIYAENRILLDCHDTR